MRGEDAGIPNHDPGRHQGTALSEVPRDPSNRSAGEAFHAQTSADSRPPRDEVVLIDAFFNVDHTEGDRSFRHALQLSQGAHECVFLNPFVQVEASGPKKRYYD